MLYKVASILPSLSSQREEGRPGVVPPSAMLSLLSPGLVQASVKTPMQG